jgi:hypothetical protein
VVSSHLLLRIRSPLLIRSNANQLLESSLIEFGSCDMNREFAIGVPYEWVRVSIVDQGFDHEGVASHDGLVESEAFA